MDMNCKKVLFLSVNFKGSSLSENVETIRKRTFYSCDKLERVVFLSSPPAIDEPFEWDEVDFEICIKREYELVKKNVSHNII